MEIAFRLIFFRNQLLSCCIIVNSIYLLQIFHFNSVMFSFMIHHIHKYSNFSKNCIKTKIVISNLDSFVLIFLHFQTQTIALSSQENKLLLLYELPYKLVEDHEHGTAFFRHFQSNLRKRASIVNHSISLLEDNPIALHRYVKDLIHHYNPLRHNCVLSMKFARKFVFRVNLAKIGAYLLLIRTLSLHH